MTWPPRPERSLSSLLHPARVSRVFPPWPRALPAVRRSLLLLLILLIGHAAWPYATLWRLHRAVARDDAATLAALVDLPALRATLACRLNKDCASPIDDLSDAFIDWLDAGIRRHGVLVLDDLVTLDWVRERLPRHAGLADGLLPRLSQARFRGPCVVQVRLGDPVETAPVTLHLRLGWNGWRVTALYQ